ncbi:unnamed protein product [Gemmata massiliana]|uniref:Uncharacterized protein n=1 Tax=Gemmata massiliana TaxID=1210884 RepID=A0A6P2D1C1_9BACT|nr:hypothetical protein [Gemmata massiliana]VTR95061.1 unnamed protein product [Gemmata massiliana]
MANSGRKREGRSGADEALAAQVAAEKTTKEAAAGAGVAERTARGREPAFTALVAAPGR